MVLIINIVGFNVQQVRILLISYPAGRHTIRDSQENCFNAVDLTVLDLKQLSNQICIGCVVWWWHGHRNAVRHLDSLNRSCMIEKNDCINKSPFFIHHGETPFPDLGDEPGKPGSELFSGSHAVDGITLRIICCHSAVFNPCAIRVERGKCICCLFEPFEI